MTFFGSNLSPQPSVDLNKFFINKTIKRKRRTHRFSLSPSKENLPEPQFEAQFSSIGYETGDRTTKSIPFHERKETRGHTN